MDTSYPSLLFAEAPSGDDVGERDTDRSYAPDLNLDQTVAAVAGEREERELITNVLFSPLHDADAVRYRQEVFRDLEDPALFDEVKRFAQLMQQVRAHLANADVVMVSHLLFAVWGRKPAE